MSYEVRQINVCEVCGNKDIKSVLNLGLHPLCDDLVPINDTRKCREYPIEILFCETCCTGHQRFQVPKQDLFPSTYHYRARFTADVLNGMSSLVDSCVLKIGSLSEKKVLDIGCNDGSLLDFFRKKNALTFGIEPTGAALEAQEKGHDVINDFLSTKVAESFVSKFGKPDVITFTNVFAHIEDLTEVIDSLKILMTPATTVVIENHYLGSILDTAQFDTFYHEHPRSYSYRSFEFIAKKLGTLLLEAEFPSRYGGNIRVFLGNHPIKTASTMDVSIINKREDSFLGNFLTLSKKVDNWRKSKSKQIKELASQGGKLYAKAFPGRAAILIKLLGLNEDTIAAVFEKPGSLKIGHYVPGTRIPIKSDNDFLNLSNKNFPLLNLAWHIPTEIRSYLLENGHTGPVIDIIKSGDFSTGQ